ADAPGAVYTLRIAAATIHENPVPLNTAPVPGYRLHLFTLPPVQPPAPPAVSDPLPRLVLPTLPNNGIQFVVAQKPGDETLNVTNPGGLFAGLSAAPQGVLTGGPRDSSPPPRLLRPGFDP